MTTKVKKTATETAKAVEVLNVPFTNLLVGATEPVLKGLALFGATELMKQPQFAAQANQASIIQLADLFFNYIIGKVQVEQTGAAEPEAPVFG